MLFFSLKLILYHLLVRFTIYFNNIVQEAIFRNLRYQQNNISLKKYMFILPRDNYRKIPDWLVLVFSIYSFMVNVALSPCYK